MGPCGIPPGYFGGARNQRHGRSQYSSAGRGSGSGTYFAGSVMVTQSEGTVTLPRMRMMPPDLSVPAGIDTVLGASAALAEAEAADASRRSLASASA